MFVKLIHHGFLSCCHHLLICGAFELHFGGFVTGKSSIVGVMDIVRRIRKIKCAEKGLKHIVFRDCYVKYLFPCAVLLHMEQL